MYQHIVVTTDGTDIDHAAVRHAAGLSRALNATLTLLHIIPDAHRELSSGTDLSVTAEQTERDWALQGEAALHDGELDAGDLRLVTVQRPALGLDVPHAILREAAALDADLIVMATHGRTGLAHLILGSVAERVVHGAGVPVLLVHQAPTPCRRPQATGPGPGC
ncbi:nucleotide-binding universal stress UspA family protein [Deinococcus metalli]|uniref:Nucleotide-binding universal stress UspA family protein n=1 Tax=Deinococcus metalli TaxID=1141878 RepID=A0A7W8NQ43_9DEIO|nr:universal stress protein [Deinococcus metalli]MBB5378634.1 nucleotide-binding universal stress UspA family protein [Deinococcus metalli]GHF61290.1 universal stress protein UspA [Deinococcus metalli]